ncbi:MAG: hypothetical protein J6332_01890 [Abditibacteriota bacterium]|nr:hypothetical protein [Abditibacteriota bacterium]
MKKSLFIAALMLSAVCCFAAPAPIYKSGDEGAFPSGLTEFTVVCKINAKSKADFPILSKTDGKGGFDLRNCGYVYSPVVEVTDGGGKTRIARFDFFRATDTRRLAFSVGGGKLTTYSDGVFTQSVDCPGYTEGGEFSAGPDTESFAVYDGVLSEKDIRLLWDNSFRTYDFNGSVSEDVLNSYLSRAVTAENILSPAVSEAEFNDHAALIANIGAMFIGRASLIWDMPAGDIDEFFRVAAARAKRIHTGDKNVIFQAAILECVSDKANTIKISPRTLSAFGQEVKDRNFDYKAMIFENGKYVNQWGENCSVPDMTRIETRMWFYEMATRYIDAGFEAFHMGQIWLMGDGDKNYAAWNGLLGMIRDYAKLKARRHYVLFDAHNHGTLVGGVSIFDFNSFPVRHAPVDYSSIDMKLEKGWGSAIFGKSAGCKTPSGWSTKSLPYLVELDNGDRLTDEITWFAAMPQKYRGEWIGYATEWLYRNDPMGHFQPVIRRVSGNVGDDCYYYSACEKLSVPGGVKAMNDVEALKSVFTAGFVGPLEPPVSGVDGYWDILKKK